MRRVYPSTIWRKIIRHDYPAFNFAQNNTARLSKHYSAQNNTARLSQHYLAQNNTTRLSQQLFGAT